jgi:tRNA pseudouridine55 synthase
MNGIIIVDKPKGYTSRDVVNSIERLANTKKVGHGGTLDPIATGVLVIALGNGLKVLEFLSHQDKEYVATVKMGIETNTLDVTGEVTKKKDYFFFDEVKVDEVLKSFIGEYEQEVPLYSSVKVGGQRLYKYAREGKDVELPKRNVKIHELELLSHNNDEFVIRANVSKGISTLPGIEGFHPCLSYT